MKFVNSGTILEEEEINDDPKEVITDNISYQQQTAKENMDEENNDDPKEVITDNISYQQATKENIDIDSTIVNNTLLVDKSDENAINEIMERILNTIYCNFDLQNHQNSISEISNLNEGINFCANYCLSDSQKLATIDCSSSADSLKHSSDNAGDKAYHDNHKRKKARRLISDNFSSKHFNIGHWKVIFFFFISSIYNI